MNAAESNLPVKMTRVNFDGLPEFTLPLGFALRWYQQGDEAHWLRIHLVADRLNQITPELFQKEFAVEQDRGLPTAAGRERQSGMSSAIRTLGGRQCYLLASHGEVIGTGTAWFNDDFEGARWGRVHWVAILPEFQGQGLGKALMSVICQRLRELGHRRAYLTTSTARIPAIRLYLQFGFAPLVRNEEEAAVWRELQPHLKCARPPGE